MNRMNLAGSSLVIATILTGLIAGLFYSWSCSVMPGLKNVKDAEFVASMQSMNKAIQNPVFFLSFFGTLLLLPLATFFNYESSGSPVFLALLAASLIYIIGVFGVTVFFNIPLNNMLDSADLANASSVRSAFEKPWNNYNTIRTICSSLSLSLAVIACFLKR